MNNNDLKEKKTELRFHLKKSRANLSKPLRENFSAQITQNLLSLVEIQSAETLFVYISYASEVETHNLITELLESGKTIAVPKILSDKKMIAVKFNDWDDLQAAELGILTPISIEPLEIKFDVCITPGLGFTVSGKRIGFGAGYYDRWFSENITDHKIALAFEQQIIDDIPTDEYDQTVDKIITEKQIITTRR